jgi:hypothetical protein
MKNNKNSYLDTNVTIETEEILTEDEENAQLLPRPEPGKLGVLVKGPCSSRYF